MVPHLEPWLKIGLALVVLICPRASSDPSTPHYLPGFIGQAQVSKPFMPLYRHHNHEK